MSEIPVHPHPRRLSDWINPTEAKKVHSLIDKIYQRKNLEMAWERVRANRGSGGVDGQSIREFGEQVEEQLNRLQTELQTSGSRRKPGWHFRPEQRSFLLRFPDAGIPAG